MRLVWARWRPSERRALEAEDAERGKRADRPECAGRGLCARHRVWRGESSRPRQGSSAPAGDSEGASVVATCERSGRPWGRAGRGTAFVGGAGVVARGEEAINARRQERASRSPSDLVLNLPLLHPGFTRIGFLHRTTVYACSFIYTPPCFLHTMTTDSNSPPDSTDNPPSSSAANPPMTIPHPPKKKRMEDPSPLPPDIGLKPVQLQRRRVWRACESCR